MSAQASLEAIQLLLTVLRALLKDVLDLNNRSMPKARCGICTNMREYDEMIFAPSEISTEALALRDQLFTDWPYYDQATSKRSFPIPGGEDAYMFHSHQHTLWTGEQLVWRLHLIRYCIKRLRDMERRAKRRELTKSEILRKHAEGLGMPVIDIPLSED